MADWFLFEGRRFGNPHALIRPGESRPIITDTNMRVMLEMTRGLAGPGQMVHRYYSSFNEDGLPEYNRTYYYHSRENSLRSTTSDIPGLMTRIGLRFMHPSEEVNFNNVLTFYWVHDVRDFCQYSHPSCPSHVGGLPRLTFQSEQNPTSDARLSSLLRSIGVSEQLIVTALGMAPRTTPRNFVGYAPGYTIGYAAEAVRGGDLGVVVNWSPGDIRHNQANIVPAIVAAETKDIHEDYVYGAGEAFPDADEIWGPEETGLSTTIYFGDLYRYNTVWDGGEYRIWDEPSEFTSDDANSYWGDRRIRHLNSMYRFRFASEHVHFGDFVFWHSYELKDASHCVRAGDIGKLVSEFSLVVTRADLSPLDFVRKWEDGWRYVNPGEHLIDGDFQIPSNTLLRDPVHVVTDKEPCRYARPIGYKQEIPVKPEFPCDLPDGYVALRGNRPNTSDVTAFIGFWVGRSDNNVEYIQSEYGDLPPHMAKYIITKVDLTPMLPSLEPYPGITVRFNKKLSVCDQSMNVNRFSALILNVHGVMVIDGTFGVNGPGWNLHTLIGQFAPFLFDINGTERLVFVSHNIHNVADMENRLARGLGQMTAASSFYTGGTFAISSQHTNLTSYATGRQVEL